MDKNIIYNYNALAKQLEEKQRPIIEAAIRVELDKLVDEEIIYLNSHSCEGNAISTLIYNDVVASVTGSGKTTCYSSYDCLLNPDQAEFEDSIFGFALPVMVKILECCIHHNEQKVLSIKDFENLAIISNHLDPNSNLDNSMKKAIKILNNL